LRYLVIPKILVSVLRAIDTDTVDNCRNFEIETENKFATPRQKFWIRGSSRGKSGPADSASEIAKFTISIPRESCTNAKAKYSSSVVPPDPSVHFYHWGQDQSSMEMLTTLY